MKCNQAGIDLIKKFEGLRLKAYRDIVGKLTIGYGHAGDDFGPGDEWTQEQVDQALVDDLATVEEGIGNRVTKPLTDNQFAALCSFCYNLGLQAFTSSTLLRCINKGNFDDAACEFVRWDHAGGVVVSGLLERRKAESELFKS